MYSAQRSNLGLEQIQNVQVTVTWVMATGPIVFQCMFSVLDGPQMVEHPEPSLGAVCNASEPKRLASNGEIEWTNTKIS